MQCVFRKLRPDEPPLSIENSRTSNNEVRAMKKSRSYRRIKRRRVKQLLVAHSSEKFKRSRSRMKFLKRCRAPDNAVINRGANYREGIHHALRWENNEPVNSRDRKKTEQRASTENRRPRKPLVNYRPEITLSLLARRDYYAWRALSRFPTEREREKEAKT